MLPKVKNNSKGFTLIELLIVIVIIGILSGVAISVIDPKKQQDRARDASIKATMNKAALSTEGYVSAYGEAPHPIQFIDGLKNFSYEDCTSSSDGVSCNFQVEGNVLPSTCGVDGWSGNGTSQCYYHYVRNDPEETGVDTTRFYLYAKSYGLSTSLFKYDNTRGVILVCDADDPESEDGCVE